MVRFQGNEAGGCPQATLVDTVFRASVEANRGLRERRGWWRHLAGADGTAMCWGAGEEYARVTADCAGAGELSISTMGE